MNRVAPAHNPPYIAAMRLLGERLPEIPLVAAFETGFHATIPDRLRYYAAPYEWAEKHARSTLGLSRRQPPLYRDSRDAACSDATICGSFRATLAAQARCVRSAAARALPRRWG